MLRLPSIKMIKKLLILGFTTFFMVSCNSEKVLGVVGQQEVGYAREMLKGQEFEVETAKRVEDGVTQWQFLSQEPAADAIHVALVQPKSPQPKAPQSKQKASSDSIDERFYPERWSNLLEDIVRCFTIFAIVVGGVWTYFNFFKGRTFSLRLEPKVFGKISFTNKTGYLVATACLKNVGLSKLKIDQKGTGLRVLLAEVITNIQQPQVPNWQQIESFEVFKAHQWIEPGETVEENLLVIVPQHNHLAVKLELMIVSGKLEWYAMTVVIG